MRRLLRKGYLPISTVEKLNECVSLNACDCDTTVFTFKLQSQAVYCLLKFILLLRSLEVYFITFIMESGLMEPTLYSIEAIAIMNSDGNRVLAKYYGKQFPTAKEQKVFEKNLFKKTHRANGEVLMLDGLTIVYRSNVDLYFYVMGNGHENELILVSVLNCLHDAVNTILRKNVSESALLENLDVILLAIDEICDGGIVLEADSTSVVQRVAVRSDDIPLGEQTVAQVLQSAKEQLKWSLLK